jgi:SAM-dependent methyltransferase
MVCPLCMSSNFIVVNSYDLTDLGQQWKSSFGFNPFLSGGRMSRLRCAECDLIYYDPANFGDSNFYEELSKFLWYYEESKWEFDEAIKYILKLRPDSLLEIGCGKGVFLDKIRHVIKNAEGLDINRDALEICKQKGLNVFYPPLPSDKSYDMVVLFEVLEHLDNPAEHIRDILKMLNPNGVLIIAVPNPEGIFKESSVPVLLDMPPHHNTSWSENTFNYLAKINGLEKIGYATEPLRYVHYLTYLISVTKSFTSLKEVTFQIKVLRKLNLILLPLFAPFSFTADRTRLLGQTHLVVFRKAAY